MSEIVNLSRRDVLRTSALMGAGLVLGFFILSPSRCELPQPHLQETLLRTPLLVSEPMVE